MPRNEPHSLPGDLFDRLTASDTFAKLKEMAEGDQKSVESEWLEFKAFPLKSFKDPSAGLGTKNLVDPKKDFIKETWSQVLSAFANTQGGVLIWGIYAAKNSDGVDQAESLLLAPNPEALATRLTELHYVSCDPPVPNVQIVPVIDPDSGSGLVICYVPESTYAPHRAIFSGDQFYYRCLDKSVIMPIPMLRRMFYPHTQARFRIYVGMSMRHFNPTLYAEFKRSPTITSLTTLMNGSFAIDFQVRMTNDGTSTAKDLYVIVNATKGSEPIYQRGEDWNAIPNPASQAAFVAKRPLHPGSLSVLFTASSKDAYRAYPVNDGFAAYFEEYILHFLIYAENLQPQEAIVCFTQDQFNENIYSRVNEVTAIPRPI